MIATTIAAQRAIMSDSRRWNLILTDGRGNTLESKDGAVISMDHSIEPSSGVLTVGDIFTQNINIELRRSIDDDGTKFDYSTNSEMKIAYSLLDAPGIIHMGSFRVKKVEKAKDRIRLQLKDYFYNELNEKYVPSSSLTYPAPIMDVMQDICGVMYICTSRCICCPQTKTMSDTSQRSTRHSALYMCARITRKTLQVQR